MYPRQNLYECGLGEHWRLQIGDVSPAAFARQIGGCEELVRRFTMYGELSGHGGCVSSVSFDPTGELLVSGSFDQVIIVWNWAERRPVFTYNSGHEKNVFQALVMPHCDNRIIVTCAADGQVRYGAILQDGSAKTKCLGQHRGHSHKMAIEPGSSRIIYSCGEDGVVQHIDLREEKAKKLLTCHKYKLNTGKPSQTRSIRLHSIVMDPIDLNYFAVGGSDQYARVYDIRRLNASGLIMEDQPVETYTPKHLQGLDYSEQITSLAYSHQRELLVSYNDDLIYLFDKSMNLGDTPHINVQFYDLEDDIEGEARGTSNLESLSPQVYQGHRNYKTVKGVNFFGPRAEYVVSGSDCGRIFIWRKKGGRLVALMKGDHSVVNCVEPHPHATILATSGIDPTIKIWSPEATSTPHHPEHTDTSMRRQWRRRYSHLTSNRVRFLFRTQHLRVGQEDITRTQLRDQGGPDREGLAAMLDDIDDDIFADADTPSPSECIVI